jgi:hypothetical protein
MSDGGKGSRPRPFSVSNEDYAKRWDLIFGRDLEKKENNESSRSDANDRNKLSEQVSGVGRQPNV